jgi:hypothetical protein
MSVRPSYESLLKDLKSKLDKGEMSTLVGAGFSKNLDVNFPDWFELVNEMVIFTEGKRLGKELSDRYPKLGKISKKYQALLKDEIWNHITTVGPLIAVSNYIKLKGFRESVDHIVDNNTPYIEVENGKRYLRRSDKGGITRRVLTERDIASHQKLVNLPWNNIFTTNYDNLLEKCIDVNKKEDVEKMITDLKSAIDIDSKETKHLESKLNNKKLNLDQMQFEMEEKIARREPIENISAAIEKLEIEISLDQSEIDFKLMLIKGQHSRLENLSDIQRNFRMTVIKSSDLAVRKNQNIIKIHGSICTDEPKTFGFDGDPAKNYVISQEDYDSYPNKHEAFTQLMRISLLQESFCLFGFSGIDPNFLGWIGWVRDVIQKSPVENSTVVKIFMIDVWDKYPDPDKALFYKNHQIAFIPLADPECLKFLEKITGKSVADNSPTARINLLLDYLSMDNVPSENKINYEVIKQNEYQSLWDKIPYFQIDGEKIDSFIRKTDELRSLKNYKRIPVLLGNTDTSQYHFLKRFKTIHQIINGDENAVFDLLKITLLMLQEIYLPSSLIFIDDKETFPLILKLSKKFPKLNDQFLLIDYKDAIWSNDHARVKKLAAKLKSSKDAELIQEIWYQSALYDFYNFRFIELRQILREWHAIGHWAMKKAGLQSHLSLEDAITELRSSEQETVQEDVYKHHILSYLFAANGARNDGERQYKIVRAVEKGNIKSFNHIVKRMVNSFKAKPEKLLPYGDQKFTITNTQIFSETPRLRTSLQLLNLWLEIGHPLQLPGISNLSTEEVYAPLKLALSWYPEPVLFFVLQYSNSAFVIRISQDLAYIQDVEKIKSIAQRVMEAFFNENTPLKFKKNLLLVLSEFISVLHPVDWQDFYLSVWKLENENNLLFLDHRVHKQEFLNRGISFLTDPVIAKILIEQLLEAFINADDEQVKNNVIQFLYQFRHNTYLNELVKENGLDIEPKLFDELITRLKNDVFFLFVIGNISFSFTQSQFARVKQTLQEVGAFENTNPRLWRVILYFGDGDLGIEQRVKEGILKSHSLWNSGINLANSSFTSHQSHVALSALKNYRKSRSLQWSDEENKLIFEGLVTELDKIYHWMNNLDRSTDFRDILKEMKYFLETEESSLNVLDRFSEAKTKLSTLFDLERTSEQSIDAIFSDNKSSIILQIENISNEIFKSDRLIENDFLISGLLYKLLLKKEPGLAATLSAIANWFYIKWESIALKKYQSHLELILQSYKSGNEIDVDEPFYQEQMIKIAIVLKKWGSEAASITETIELLTNSRFNNTKFNLKSELIADKML